MAEFTPDQEKEFEFRARYEQEQAAKQAEAAPQTGGRDEATASTNQIMGGGVGAAVGAAARNLPQQIGNMVRDPVTGKWMALENYGRQMFGNKWYGGANMSDVYQRGYKASGDPLKGIAPDPIAAAKYEAEALKGITPGQKIAAKTPGMLKPLLTSPMGTLGRGVAGLGAGMQGADAMTRYNEGDTSGAIISGLGAMGTAAAMIPHPVARIVGTGVGLGAEGLNMFLDKLKNKKQMAKGGLVDEEDGLSKAEKAALRIMKNKKKVKHLAGGGTTTATGDSTFNNTNVGMPNIVLPAMGIDENGVSTPAPVQVWNERTGQYQSQTDTTPGAMPGPVGGLGGLLAGENPAVTQPSPVSTTQPTNTDAFMLSGPLGGVNTNVAQTTNPFANIGSIAQQGDTFQPTQQNVSGAIPQATPPFQTQNLLNPQTPLQAAPNSPVAAASPPKLNFANAMRSGLTPNAFNRFGTPLNQVRQSGLATPQSRGPMAPRMGLPNLARFRRP